MNLEQARLNTFQSWPANAEVEPRRIAKAGFFYIGNGLEVECFSCGKRISEWNYGDQVMARHRQLNPDCLFVKDPTTSGNIPVVNRSSSVFSQVSESPQDSLLSSFQCSGDSSSDLPQNSGVRHVTEGNSNNTVVRSSENVGDNYHKTLNPNIDISLYRNESRRLDSFASWPKSHIVSPRSLAKTGFFYLQDGDRVQCAFCYGKVHGWEQGDDPEVEHRRHFPSCPVHYNVPSGNSPVNDCIVSDVHVQTESGSDLTNVEEVRPFSFPERDGPVRVLNEEVQPDLSDLGIRTHRGPKHPKYSTIESRLRSFSNWPPNANQAAQHLAEAGFFYTGVNDQVRCFHCDGGLRQWDANDEPWIEHARWFSKCTFVILVKGEEFIQNAQAQHPPLLPANSFQRATVPNLEQDQIEYRIRDVTDEEINRLMGTPPVQDALDIGLEPSKIRQALRLKMEQTGFPFTCSDALIIAVLDISSNTASGVSSRQSSNPTMREEITLEINSSHSYGRPCEGQSTSLNVSKSLPSIVGYSSEPTMPEQDAKTQSMPRLPNERSLKKTVENESSLEEENRRLKEARLCKICMDEEVGAVFVPCGHLATCVNCAASVQNCPMCRQPIKATVRTFLS